MYGKTQAKVEKRQNIHGKMDLGDAAITPHKVLNNVHLDAGQGSPIHIKVIAINKIISQSFMVYHSLAFEYEKQRRRFSKTIGIDKRT